MKNITYIIALSILGLMSTQAALGDIKIKSRQTSSGQSYENTTYIKGKRSRSEAMNGMTITVTQCDLRRSIQMNPASKTYMVNPFATTVETSTTNTTATKTNGTVQPGGKVTTTITTKDTGERKQMFGYTARHLIITMEMVSSPDSCSKTNNKMQTDGWYIDAEFALDCDQGYAGYRGTNGGKAGGCQDKYEYKQIGTAKRGYPVYERMTMFDASGKEIMNMVNEVLEFSKATLEPGLFEIPGDYREVSDASQMYASASQGSAQPANSSSSRPSSMALPNTAVSNSTANPSSTSPGAKKPGTIRIGLSSVKTGAVGEGITAADLATAVQNTLISFLKVPNIEVVTLDARLASAIDSEAAEKECDYVIFANASHKKGGGFGGMFGKVIAPAIGSVGLGHTGSTVGNVAGMVATRAIVTAGAISSNVKSKDEITLDVKLSKTGGSNSFVKVYKAKAKSDGEDIISGVIEQAAQAIVDTIEGSR